MILKEANDLSYVQKFKDAQKNKDPELPIKLIKEFLKSCNFKNYNEEEYNKFVDTNSHTLYLECDIYSLSLENPFFKFLQEYSLKNSNISPFLIKENYNIVHNLIAKDIIETKQLANTCSVDKQIRILFNPNLWSIQSKNDINYLIKLFNWVLDTKINDYVLNYYVKILFSPEKITDYKNVDLKKINLDNFNTKQLFLRCLFFTDYINKIDDRNLINDDNKISEYFEGIRNNISKLADNAMFVSAKFRSVDEIEQAVKMLKENVQEGNRGLDGKYRETDTNNKITDKKTANNINPTEKRQILNKSAATIEAIKRDYGITDKQSIRDILKILGDIY